MTLEGLGIWSTGILALGVLTLSFSIAVGAFIAISSPHTVKREKK